MSKQQLGLAPYLVVQGASDALAFYAKVFGAREIRRIMAFEKVMYAEVEIGDSTMMISDEYPDFGLSGPQSLGGSPVSLHLYVEDADQIFEKAIQAGATMIKPVENQFFGDRHGQVKDPFGYTWTIATRIEEISNALFQEKMDAVFNQGKS